MKNNIFILSSILLFIIFSAGCTNASEKTATISVNADSEYVNTFDELALGILFDFDFKLPDADKRWIKLWVERYVDGEKDPDPLIQLYSGDSPNKVDEGNLGFGIINPNSEDVLGFLYKPDISMYPKKIEIPSQTDRFIAWNYAIDEEKVELELDETKILAFYREREGNSIRTVDLQDENEVNRIIEEDRMVLLLKIKIEERN